MTLGGPFFEQYERICEEKEVTALLPHTDVSTRWHSTFYLIQVVLQREIEFRVAYGNLGILNFCSLLGMDFPLSDDDMTLLTDIYFLLQYFENASKDLEGEEYCYISDLIPILRGLKENLQELDNIFLIDGNTRVFTNYGLILI